MLRASRQSRENRVASAEYFVAIPTDRSVLLSALLVVSDCVNKVSDFTCKVVIKPGVSLG